MKVRKLAIKNFRGIKELDWVLPIGNIFCLIGKGDSSKSTILESIRYVFYPQWCVGKERSKPLNRTRDTRRSTQFVPDPAPATALVQVTALDQRAQVLLERIAAGAGQFDGLTDGDTTMLTGKLHNPQ